MTPGYRQLVDAAEREIETLDPAAASALLGGEDIVFVDVRDVREVRREGRIPGSFHCPRGMLESWIDPQSPYAKDVFARDARFVFYCNPGGCPSNREPAARLPQRPLSAILRVTWEPPCSPHDRRNRLTVPRARDGADYSDSLLGRRSALAAQTASHMGLGRVCHIGGGYTAWAEAGLATEMPAR